MNRHSPGILSGALVGACLTIILIAICYPGWKIFGFPFLPFDLFDWTSRNLPGFVITFGIDLLVQLIHTLHAGDTSTAAKRAEQILAVLNFIVLGILAGAVLFGILRIWPKKSYLASIILGVGAGVLALLLTRSVKPSVVTNPVGNSIWTLILFTGWGLLLGWAHRRLTPGDVVSGTESPPVDTVIERVGRRRFILRLGGATALITIVGAGLGAFVGRREKQGKIAQTKLPLNNIPLPNADSPIKPAPGTRPELTPLDRHYRIDINTVPPSISGDSWRLKIGGLVDHPLELSLEELHRYPSMEQFITLSCISNPVGGDLIGTALWKGVSLKRLLPDWKLNNNATHLKISSADGFFETIALDIINSDERVMLAYEWDGVPLLSDHGFPLRIYIPDHFGMKQPKWIESIEAIDHTEDGFWVVRGWDREARMKATSVIDVITVDMMIGQANQSTIVPVGGIAHAGARGISKVEVQVDGGSWREAQLRPPLSGLTWVVWRYDWPFQKGKHTFVVRCYDGNGVPQITEDAPPHPGGATGLNRKSAML